MLTSLTSHAVSRELEVGLACPFCLRRTTADLHVEKGGIIKGVGLALANAPMEQDRVYFGERCA